MARGPEIESMRGAMGPIGMTLRGLLIGAVAVGALAACQGQLAKEVRWGYGPADGPGQWSTLAPEYGLCAEGTEQSPVDLGDARAGALPPLTLDWTPGAATLRDTGYAIQVDLPAAGGLTLDGRAYGLAQFHVHTPSEHTIDGKPAPLELHFVHADPEGRLAVVGVMVREGEAHPGLQPLVDGLAGLKPGGGGVSLADFDPRALLPGSDGRTSYPGSLTTPPCSEGVAWNVMATPITASTAQIAAFAERYPDNARPVQSVGDRALVVERPVSASR